MLAVLLNLAAIISLAIAAISDLRTREVPDWLSYATLAFGFGIRIIASAINLSWQPLLAGILGFLAFLIIALIMFYTGQWGGGDSKLLMGIGALLGLEPNLILFPPLLTFWINSVIVGALYGLLYSFIIAAIHKNRFLRAYRKKRRESRIILLIFLLAAVLLSAASFLFTQPFIRSGILLLAVSPLFTFFLYLFIKSVEEAIMIKKIPVEKLTEGDWIVKEINIDGKYICGPKDLGIEKKQIKTLLEFKKQDKIKTITIKEGIPFVPSFFIAYLLTITLGNWFWLFV